MKKILSLLLACTFVVTIPTQSVYGAAYSDEYVLNDSVQATYTGHQNGSNINKELQYLDLDSEYGYDIAKLGALNFLKGYEKYFNPTSTATNLDTLSILLNMQGYEPEALELAVEYQDDNPDFDSLKCKNLSYVELAAKYGYITEREALNALSLYEVNGFEELATAPKTQESIDGDTFDIKGSATRADIAEWIGIYLENTAATIPETPNVGQYSVTDHSEIAAYQIPYVDTVLANGIMTSINGEFKPDGTMTKGELAHTMVQLEPYYSENRGFQTITGVVGAIKNDDNKTDKKNVYDVYIRGTDGNVYILSTTKYTDDSGLSTEIPTYKNGKMINNRSLSVNDTVEFVVTTGTDLVFPANTALFTGVTEDSSAISTVTGTLKDLDLDAGTISLTATNSDSLKTYKMIDGIYDSSGLIMEAGTESDIYAPDEIPYGAKYTLTLKDDVVTKVTYIGQETLINDVRGIVIENEPDFGYMVVLGYDNVKRVYNYYPNEIKVEKQPYYDHEDYVGYYDEIFQYDGYDPRDATVYDIEPGDLVFLVPNEDDPSYIDSISVTPTYIQRTGVINKVTVNDGYTTVLVTFDDGSVSSYQVPDDVIVRKDNGIYDASYLEVGDNAKFLINEAIIDSGYIVESVKEIAVEEQGHEVSSIVKGTLSGYNQIENEVSLTDAETLETNGWTNKDLMGTYSLPPNEQAEMYINGTKTTPTNFNRLLRNNDDYVVYMAVEENYSGDNVEYVTSYDGRDTLLTTDMITNISSDGNMVLQSTASEYPIKEDAIVVKNDKLVDKSALQPYDMVQVALNGGEASVVKVVDTIDNTDIQVSRGRIQSVDEGNSFTVKSLVLLEDNEWVYSPIERTYAVDNNTIYITEDGTVNDIDTFLGYTQDTVIDKVYNVISDGYYADYVIESPYCNEDVNGTVYKVEDGIVYLKDVSYYDKENKSWHNVGVSDNTATVTLAPNTVTIKDSEVIDPSNIAVGDKMFVKTDNLEIIDDQPLELTGYINFIED